LTETIGGERVDIFLFLLKSYRFWEKKNFVRMCKGENEGESNRESIRYIPRGDSYITDHRGSAAEKSEKKVVARPARKGKTSFFVLKKRGKIPIGRVIRKEKGLFTRQTEKNNKKV